MSAAHKITARGYRAIWRDYSVPHLAGDLLGRLVGRGELVMLGAKKGAFYERPSKDLEGSKSAPKAP